jgi:hypothetical protein
MGQSTSESNQPVTVYETPLGSQGNYSSSVGNVNAFTTGNQTIYSQSPEALALAGSIAGSALEKMAAAAQGVIQIGESQQASAAKLYAGSNFAGQLQAILLPILLVVGVVALIWVWRRK